MGEDDAPTGLAPTELGVVEETEAHTAWSLDDDWEEPARGSWRVVVAAVVGSLAVVVAAGAVAVIHMRQPTLGVVSFVPPSVEVSTGPRPSFDPATGFPDPPPPPTATVTVERPAQVAPVLPAHSGYSDAEMAAFDRQFLARMSEVWRIDDPGLMTLRAHQVCVDFAQGVPAEVIYQKLLNLGSSGDEAVTFMNVTTQTYPDCG